MTTEKMVATEKIVATQPTIVGTQQTQLLGRALLAPAVILLFIWMIVPLVMTPARSRQREFCWL